MKKLIVSLMVMATFASCGKANKTDTGAGANVGIAFTNPQLINNILAQKLISKIDNSASAFGLGTASSGNTNQNCSTTMWGLLQYCTYGGTGTTSGVTWNSLLASRPSLEYYYSNGDKIISSNVNIAAKQNELRSLLQSATDIQGNETVFYIRSATSVTVIDTRLPIQANPAAIQSQAVSKYFVQAI